MHWDKRGTQNDQIPARITFNAKLPEGTRVHLVTAPYRKGFGAAMSSSP
jgi:hypothetical protein